MPDRPQPSCGRPVQPGERAAGGLDRRTRPHRAPARDSRLQRQLSRATALPPRRRRDRHAPGRVRQRASRRRAEAAHHGHAAGRAQQPTGAAGVADEHLTHYLEQVALPAAAALQTVFVRDRHPISGEPVLCGVHMHVPRRAHAATAERVAAQRVRREVSAKQRTYNVRERAMSADDLTATNGFSTRLDIASERDHGRHEVQQRLPRSTARFQNVNAVGVSFSSFQAVLAGADFSSATFSADPNSGRNTSSSAPSCRARTSRARGFRAPASIAMTSATRSSM